MATWYAHTAWTAGPSPDAPELVLPALQQSITALRDPGGLGYVLAPRSAGEWQAGFVVHAELVEDAAAAAAATIRTAALDVGQAEPVVTRLEVVDEHHPDRWALSVERLT
jgi:hypothetical protein